MNLRQLRSIECLTTQMLNNAPHHVRQNVIFKVEPFGESGYSVHSFNCPFHSHWTDADYQVIAFVGPRGGVKGYRVLSK